MILDEQHEDEPTPTSGFSLCLIKSLVFRWWSKAKPTLEHRANFAWVFGTEPLTFVYHTIIKEMSVHPASQRCSRISANKKPYNWSTVTAPTPSPWFESMEGAYQAVQTAATWRKRGRPSFLRTNWRWLFLHLNCSSGPNWLMLSGF